jgi:FAD synthetase
LKERKTIKVMGFGTFDGIHPGHLFFLRQLKQLGDELFVVVARDRNVKKIKGKKPALDEKKRFADLEKTRIADRVLIGHPTDFYHLINNFQPNVIGLGYDQKANTEELQEKFPNIKIVRLRPFEPEKYKSSLLKDSEHRTQN